MLQNTIARPEQDAPACPNSGGWRSQFAHPHGWVGWIAGQLMAVRNRERSLWVLSLLDLHPGLRVLEIGFGSGADIRRVAQRVPQGLAAGIDLSETMLHLAAGKNREAIAAGRVELRCGPASRLPHSSDFFDRVFAINVAQFWDTPAETARELWRVLKSGGMVALAVQPRNKGAGEQTAIDTGARLVEALTAAGFRSVRSERLAARPVPTVCALGLK